MMCFKLISYFCAQYDGYDQSAIIYSYRKYMVDCPRVGLRHIVLDIPVRLVICSATDGEAVEGRVGATRQDQKGKC